MNKPSSTITAATLTGLGVALLWQLIAAFSTIDVGAGVISASTIFAASLVGYFKKENVLGK